MPHVIESAPTGRSKCRGCEQAIPRDTLRFGERLPNAFGSGEMTLWFHLLCAAYKRPEPLLEALAETSADIPDRQQLESAAQRGMAHRRLPRIDGAERAPSRKAKCRHCREAIEQGSWRIRLIFFEDGLFSAGGFVHLACSDAYFETGGILEQMFHFSADLTADDREEIQAQKNSP